MERVFAVIPAYNEAKSIASVAREVQRYVDRVIVVDDGSTDGTSSAVGKLGVVLVGHPRNLGKGTALQTGADYARAQGCSAVVTIDGDGQHNPAEIPSLVETATERAADIVIGKRRRRRREMPFGRRMVNSSSSALLSLLTGRRIFDVHSGFRFIRRPVLDNINLAGRFDGEIGFLIDAAKAGFVIAEVAVETIYRREESKINPLRDTARFFRTVMVKGMIHAF